MLWGAHQISEEFFNVLQDAHEFLNYLLNECSELLEKEAKARKATEGPTAGENNADSASQADWQQRQRQESGRKAESNGAGVVAALKQAPPPPTWIHDLFQVRGHCRLTSVLSH